MYNPPTTNTDPVTLQKYITNHNAFTLEKEVEGSYLTA